ncbi:MAG: DNA-3-methyladenine glycosylase [Anaplasmataceae bacterium]|nr:DNA-3-methyladenine glycosylase [Anaplasmataceae bacterium]
MVKLPLTFFDRPTELVARELLGKTLVRRHGKKIWREIITEVEVYDGFDDRASHAAKGKTERNKHMYGPAGYWYIYLVYGMYWMLNIVTRENGYPAAILIRGTENFSGPGVLTRSMKIDKNQNGLKCNKESGLWIEEGVKIEPSQVKNGPRIGVHYAGPKWSKHPWRFWIDSKFL